MSEFMGHPFVTVVIIGKNEQDTIESCIVSIFNQSYTNFEVVYVDDNSSDNTFKIVQRLKAVSVTYKKCKRFIAVSVKTHFPSKNRNAGIRISKGDIIAFIDGDCVAHSDWLTSLIRQYSTGIGIVGGRNVLAHMKNTFTTKAIDLVLSSYLGSGGSAQFYKINEDRQLNEVPGGNMSAPRHLLESVGGFDETLRYNEDSDLCYRIRKNGFTIVCVHKAIVYHFSKLDTYHKFIKYFAKYGFERGKNTAKSLEYLTKFNILSLALILSVICLEFFSYFSSTAIIITLFEIGGIFLLQSIVSLKLAISSKSLALFFFILPLFITLHVVYNVGLIFGYISYKSRL